VNGEEKQRFVIELLQAFGWEEDGHSREQHFKVITHQSYPLAGGLMTLGGRPRLKRGAWKVTVGKVTTYFYKPGPGDFYSWEGHRVPTKDFEEVQRLAIELK